MTEERWSRSQLIAFRFVVSYFAITTLYLAVARKSIRSANWIYNF
jgi:hypothetical protein